MEDLQYVGFWARFWATLIDTVIFLMVLYPIFYLLYGSSFLEKANNFNVPNVLINYMFPFVAVMVLWKSKGATPGKMMIKATIVDEESLQEPSSKQLFIRYFAYILSALPLFLGYFWAGWDKKKQTWHDKLAHTVIVQPKKKTKSKSIGSYVAIGFGVLALTVFGILMLIGLMVKNGVMPDGDLYDLKKLPPKVLTVLKEKSLLEEDETLVYYQPSEIFSFTGSGVIFTKNAIRYFESNDKDEVSIWDFPFNQIGKLVLKSEKLDLGIVLITMEIYNEDGEMDFMVGLTPRSGQAEVFKAETMQRWKDALKKRP